MKRLLKAAAALVCALGFTFAHAQQTTITAAAINMGGVPIAAGTVTFTPVNASGIPIAFAQGGGGLNAPTAFSCTITAGAITGSCQVPDSALTTPANILYTVQVINTATQKTFTLQSVVGITGSTWPLDHYGPPATTSNVQPVQASYGPAAPPASCVVPSIYTRNYQGGLLYTCVGGTFVQIAGGVTAVTLANTMSSLYAAPNYMFGDSTTQGVGCDLYSRCFAGLLTNAHGGPSYNMALTGGMASDTVLNVARTINPGANVAVPQYVGVINTGINDANGCGGTNALCQQNYSAEQNAAVAIFELTGSAYQTVAPACTLTGTWTQDSANFINQNAPSGFYIGEVSTTNGNSFSCSIATTGNPIALEYVTSNGGGGAASCKVDSGSPQTIAFAPYINTAKTTYTIFRSQEFAAAAGSHTFSCTITSATGAANPVEFIAVDSIPVGQTASLPRLTMTNVVPLSGNASDAPSLAISNLVQPIVAAYKAEGANIMFADIRTPTSSPNDFASNVPGCPTNPQRQSGGLHYNDCGHRHVFNAIQAASPDIYHESIGSKTVGDQTEPFRAWGDLVTNQVMGSGQSTGNESQAFSTSSILPGAWCPYGNACLEFGATSTFVIPGFAQNQAVMRINGAGWPFCLTQNNGAGGNPINGQAQYVPYYKNCWVNNGDYYMFFPNGGSPQKAFFHPGGISRDNQVAFSGTPTITYNADVTFVGPLTANVTTMLPNCKSASTAPENYEMVFYRHGTDGFTVTFTSSSGNGDNINSGSVGNSFVWTASEGNKLTMQCSAGVVGGSSWTLSTN